MNELFRQSFYSLWFQNVPDQIIESAMNEVSGFSESRLISKSCPRLWDEYLVLKTVIFLTTFMKVGWEVKLSVPNDDGEGDFDLNLKSITNSGVQSFVKKDSIDSSLSREYFEPSIPDGQEVSDFPLGAIKTRIEGLQETCKKAHSLVGGVTSRRPLNKCGSISQPVSSKGGRTNKGCC